jgi:hypothetical protein
MRALSGRGAADGGGSMPSACALDFAGGIHSPSCMEWRVTFRLRKSDCAAASYNLLLHNPWTWVAQGIFTIMVVYLMFAMPAKSLGYALLIAAAVIFLAGTYLVSPLWQARWMAEEKELQGAIEWRLAQATMSIQSEAGLRTFPYGQFNFAIFGKRLIIMRQEKGNRNSIIPLRAFNSEQDKIAFRNFLFERLSGGRRARAVHGRSRDR